MLTLYKYKQENHRCFSIVVVHENVARSGITVTLRHRNHKILTQDKNDSGTETLADGFSTTKTIRARIVSSGRADGVVKLDYGMFGYLWDGKPVSFYGD